MVRYYPYFDRAFQCLKDCIGAQARVPLSMQAVAAAKTVKDLYVGRALLLRLLLRRRSPAAPATTAAPRSAYYTTTTTTTTTATTNELTNSRTHELTN